MFMLKVWSIQRESKEVSLYNLFHVAKPGIGVCLRDISFFHVGEKSRDLPPAKLSATVPLFGPHG